MSTTLFSRAALQVWQQTESVHHPVDAKSGLQTAGRRISQVRLTTSRVCADYAVVVPSALACFDDDFEARVAHLRLPVTHRRVTRTANPLEWLLVAERRCLKIVPNGFGEKPVLNLMFGALIRAAERRRRLRLTSSRCKIAAVRKDLNDEYQTSITPPAQSSEPRVSSKSRLDQRQIQWNWIADILWQNTSGMEYERFDNRFGEHISYRGKWFAGGGGWHTIAMPNTCPLVDGLGFGSGYEQCKSGLRPVDILASIASAGSSCSTPGHRSQSNMTLQNSTNTSCVGVSRAAMVRRR
jgi:hypothetical protein